MAKELEPQLTEEDLDLIRETRRDIHAGRAIPITIRTLEVAGVDPHTDEPIGTVTETTISGVVHMLTEEDRLLRLGGLIQVGDLKLTLHHEDLPWSINTLRRALVQIASQPGLYKVDAVACQGIGLKSRVDLGLVLTKCP